ncbi:hypothetical protein Tco_0238526 [Tanacetum coccineum]
MTTLKFADTHNMVAFLSKPAKSKGFEQIVDFLNAHTIKYALTINPIIYTSCIEQFWATVKAKTVNGDVQLQALVDGKKIIITESIVRRDLQLEDAEGVDCLPNATIFEQLTLIGYEKISQKLTFYKAVFSPQWKFLIHTILQCLSSKTTTWNKFSSTMASRGKGFFGRVTPLFPTIVVHNPEEMGEGLAIPTDPHHTPTFIQQSPQSQKTQKHRRPKKKDTQVAQSSVPSDNVADEAIYKELDDSLVRAATTASSLEAEQDSGNIIKNRSKATPNEAGSQRTTSGGGPRHQETIGDTIAQTRSENVSKLSNDPLLARGNTLRSDEDSLKLQELMALFLALETIKTTQATEIASLKRRVKKLERRNKSRTHGLKRLYRVGLSRRVESSKDEDGDEVIVESVDVVSTTKETRSVVEEVTAITIPVSADTTTTTTTAITDVEMTLAQSLAELKSAKPKADKVVIQEPEQGTTTPTLTTTTDATTIIAISTRPRAKGLVKVQYKGKGKMVEPEPMNKMSKKELLRLDEELAFKLQAEEEEEERLAKEKAQQVEEANIAWDDVQAKIDADY